MAELGLTAPMIGVDGFHDPDSLILVRSARKSVVPTGAASVATILPPAAA
jgi:hypothetical protein